jgi:1-acyl-sn-glycerol-3-phosphate acyltransferase
VLNLKTVTDLLKVPNEELVGKLKGLDPDSLMYRVIPSLLMEIMEKYFRLEVEGLENIPKRGRAIFSPNHSGYSGFDALMLAHEIQKITGRTPRVLTHRLWFITKATAIPMNKMGFIEATRENSLKFLKKNQQVLLFPEGEFGNFKPSFKAYRLQEFKRGFIRAAIETNSPIVPVIVIGAEETHINLQQLKLSKYLRGLVLPIPLNVLPLPARWKIVFLEPIHLPYKPSAVNDSELMHEIAEDLREQMQSRINKELRKRNSVYL